MLQMGKFTRAPWGSSWQKRGPRTSWLGNTGLWDLQGAGRREEARSLEQNLSRTPELCLMEGSVEGSGTSTPLGKPKESQGPPGSVWPKELIALEPGESAWQLALKKIQELSDSVGGRRREREGQGGKGREGWKRVRSREGESQSLLWWTRYKTFDFVVL